MNIEDLAQPPKTAEEQAEADRKFTETLDAAIRRNGFTSLPQFPKTMPEPARDYGDEHRRELERNAREEGFAEGVSLAVALIKRAGDHQEALLLIEQMIKNREAGK